ncbi:MAG: mandelate racemase/muconate lactonizing enzyme family protein [Solobacterium sp.]|nr:mandelate racemase/muconate lactonizing enzyme family protein [Solobacterium sp.]
MIITKVEVMKLHTGQHFTPVVCRIYTDEGIYGDGEAALAYGYSRNAAYGILKDFAPLILGRDPFDSEIIWNELFGNTFWGNNGGPVTYSGISAIDNALWDIKGKALGLPVYKLLGGKRQEKLRTYASQLQYGWSGEYEVMASAEDYADAARKAVGEGYDALKFDFFTFDRDGRVFTRNDTTTLRKRYYIDLISERMSAVRNAVGNDVDIIIENHSNTDARSAVQIAEALEPYRIFYFEEPTTATPEVTRFIRDRVNIPLASGERIYGRWQYAPYFENGSLDVIQPDVGTCGGLTEAKKIADMAQTYDVNVQVHACGSPLSTAAALQLECTLTNFVIHEHHRVALCDYMRRLCKYDYQPVDGQYAVPDLPGIGNELSEYALTHCDKEVFKLKDE